jgi:phospho-N-acetylmuramoyl-pentapeptide-transferase
MRSYSALGNFANWINGYVGGPFLAFGASLIVMLLVGKPLIAWLKSLKGMKWSPREDTPDSHKGKVGVPSMGGLGIISSACLGYLALLMFANGLHLVRNPEFFGSVMANRTGLYYVLLAVLPLFCVAHLGLGFVDDWSKARGNGGLRARDKFLGQLCLSLLFLGVYFAILFVQGFSNTNPIEKNFVTVSTHPLVPFVIFGFLLVFLIGTCNAVNITDGIDGLASGLMVQSGLALMVTQLIGRGQWGVSLFMMCLAGACFGFLAFNKFPAKVFMGDTGSLALGAALAAAAVLTGTVFLLPFIGFIFYVELLSVTSQVLYFKWTRKRTGEGKRLFRRAPLHHHFELCGWSEWRVVATFWGVNLVTTCIGLVLWYLEILPRFP